MKRSWWIIVCLCCSVCLGCKPQTPQGCVEGKAPQGVEKMCLIQKTGISRAVAEAFVDSLGNYRLTYDLKHPEIFTLTDGRYKKNIPLYIVPGDRMRVDFVAEEVKFRGDQKKNNQFLKKYHVWQQELTKQFPGNLQIPAAEKGTALNKADAAIAFIDKANLKDKVFAGTLKATVIMDKYNSLLNYPGIYKMIFGVDAPVDSDYYDFVSEVDLSSEYWVNVSGVYGFLQDLFQVMDTYGYLKAGLGDYLLKRGEQIQNDRLREEYFLYALGLELYGFNQNFNKLAAGIESQIVTEPGKLRLNELKNEYQTQLANNEAFMAGVPAFDFAGVDTDGKTHTLKELRGNIVVVDVWNTGCKPCIAEIPYLKKMEKRFEGREVVFVSYSLDTDEAVWKKFLTTWNMKGNQWIDTLGFKADIVKAFALKGIPRFMVFGRGGQIIDVYAPRPSDSRLTLLLEQELAK